MTCPTLVVIGDHDFAGPADDLAAKLPNATVKELRNVDHFATPEAFGFIDAALEFVDAMPRCDRMTGTDDRVGAIETALQVLRAGGLVAIPTETVYGLAADASNETAVRRIFAVKGRPAVTR